MSGERLTIVIAVYNGEATLERTLDSLASQTQRPHQVVVMDGGSTDGTCAILARRGDIVSHWSSGRDAGIYDAWNKALALADADWVAFLGADDHLWDEAVLERLLAAAAAAPSEVPFVYGRIVDTDAQGRPVGERGAPWTDCRERFRYTMNLPHPGMLHRRRLCFAAGGFDVRYRIAGDYALLRPLLLRQAPLFVDMVVAAAQEGGVSTRGDMRLSSVREAGRVILACGDMRPLGWWLMWVRNVLRFALWRALGDAGLERLRARSSPAPIPGGGRVEP